MYIYIVRAITIRKNWENFSIGDIWFERTIAILFGKYWWSNSSVRNDLKNVKGFQMRWLGGILLIEKIKEQILQLIWFRELFYLENIKRHYFSWEDWENSFNWEKLEN